jgi:hypothetical protein
MIIVITHIETNERTGRKETLVSHGIDSRTGKEVVLPCERIEVIGAQFNQEIGEYVLTE